MRQIYLMLLLSIAMGSASAADITAKMLAKGTALIEVNGEQHMLRAGQSSPEGVKLISASRAGAVVEFRGERHELGLERRIATRFSKAEKPEVRISSTRGGHYETPGRINGIAVDFMVDTGATTVAMSSRKAEQLGINYLAGRQMKVSTANGVARAYSVWLDSVAVGTVKVKHVEAAVILGNSPSTILLGNSYLGLVDMSTENGVLVLKARH